MSKVIAPSHPAKSPIAATVISFFLPGVGQIYLGQVIKGLALLVATFVFSIITVGLGGLALWVVSMVDAYKIGNKLSVGRSVGEWEFF